MDSISSMVNYERYPFATLTAADSNHGFKACRSSLSDRWILTCLTSEEATAVEFVCKVLCMRHADTSSTIVVLSRGTLSFASF